MKLSLKSFMMLLLCVVFLTGCSSQTTTDSSKVRLGFFPNLTHAPALVALDQQYFAQVLGTTKLETKTFPAGPELMEAFATGVIDIAYVGPVPALSGIARGIPLNIISGASNGGAILVAAPQSTIVAAKDLSNKKVAIPQLGNTQDIALRQLLLTNNLQDKAKGGNVEIFQVTPADVLSLFNQNQMDAALVPEPWGTILEKQGGAKVILDWNQIGREGVYPTAIVIVRAEFAKKNPQIIQQFLKAHQQAVQFIQQHPQDAILAVNRQLKLLTNKELPPELLATSLQRTQFTTTIQPDVLQEYADSVWHAGYLKKQVDISAYVKVQFNTP